MRISLRKFPRAVALSLLTVTLCAIASPAYAQQRTFSALDQKLEPLRSRFNQDVGKVRLVVIVDPTCPPCRWGASEIEQKVLETIPSEQLAVYVVWIPVLNFQDEATLQRNGLKESSRVSDSRAIHYVDPNGFSGKQYSAILGIRYHAPAWDVYLTFAPGIHWEDRAPAPTDWMAQGDEYSKGPRILDGRLLAQQVQKLLASASAKSAGK